MTAAPAVSPEVADTEGLPRRNGELVFEAPWEARAFGIAVAVCRAQGLEWDAFRQRLIEEISEWEQSHAGNLEWSYYERWLASLERLACDYDMISAGAYS